MVTVEHNAEFLHPGFSLPASKSISNRLLIIREMMAGPSSYHWISEADDSRVLQHCLSAFKSGKTINAGDSGTAYRFMTAFLACQPGTWKLNASARMCERPVGPLVDVLRSLGAEIKYLKNEGFPPLLINGKTLKGGSVSLDAGISSQFASALLLVAPSMEQGLEIELTGEMVSRPYIQMSVDMMRHFGISCRFEDRNLSVRPGLYSEKLFLTESDWSSAAFFYELAVVAPRLNVTIFGLKKDSIQGDARCAALFEHLGIKTSFTSSAASLDCKKTRVKSGELSIDFRDIPDLFIPFTLACAARRIRLTATGLQHLVVKESDRLFGFCEELIRLGYDCEVVNSNTFNLYDTPRKPLAEVPLIRTANDHRMAMAFAVFAAHDGAIRLSEINSVKKSFPSFRKILTDNGFSFR